MLVYDKEEPVTENLITWVFDENSFVPAAKLVGDKSYSILTDHLGTPYEAYDENGEKVWARELDIYGNAIAGDSSFIPFLYQGQYYDEEIGLAYNRFRYYSPESGTYISQDPIRLAGNNPNFYGYTFDCNTEVDVWGLDCDVAKTRKLAQTAKGANKLFECKTFANDLKAKMKKEGIIGEHIEIRNTNAPFVKSKKNDTIGANYYHQGIKVGDTIFDNLNPNGIKYDDWLDDLEYHLNHSYNIQNLEILEW